MANPGSNGIQHNMPNIGVQFVKEDGTLTTTGLSFITAIWNRTGEAPGISTDSIVAIANEALEIAETALQPATNISVLNATVTALIISGKTVVTGQQGGWGSPTGAGDRTTFVIAPIVAAPFAYDQPTTQTMIDNIASLSAHLGQLILDLKAYGALGS